MTGSGADEREHVTDEPDLAAIARSIVDANRYLALGTADGAGVPWVSPVWYAPAEYREFFWVSRPGTRHSRNLAQRPEVAMVIFDSHRAGGWNALYLAGSGEELDDVEAGIEIFSRRAVAQGLRAWTRDDVVPPAQFRLYRATPSDCFVLDPHDQRLPVSLA
jgi:nitroimidazol reductase NimA-like FMN-containing flavoprotein (pyridoxamine 5'-phosphate oxidase superfamily)